MAITTKKPPIKETVGAQYICFDQSEDGEYSGEYSEEAVSYTHLDVYKRQGYRKAGK